MTRAFPAIRTAFLAIVLAFSVAKPAAHAQQSQMPEGVEIVTSLWCDTPGQLETVVKSHYTDKVPLAEAMAAINKDSPEACIVARAIANKGAEIKRLTAGDNVMSLREASVHGIVQGRYAVMMKVQTWYFFDVVAELKSL